MFKTLGKFFVPVLALLSLSVESAQSGTIMINVDPAGTTSNLNIYGTVLNSGVATWPAKNLGAYRDYQFTLSTASGTATFDTFEVQLSALQKNKLDTTNTLRATLWAGPIPSVSSSIPSLSNALVTVTAPNSSWLSTSFRTATLTGSLFTAQTITTTPSVFFFRVWAEGGNSNSGFGTKMATSLGEYQAITMQDDIPVAASIAIDANDDGIFESSDPIAEVPEPSSCLIGAAGIILMGLRRRVARGQV